MAITGDCFKLAHLTCGPTPCLVNLSLECKAHFPHFLWNYRVSLRTVHTGKCDNERAWVSVRERDHEVIEMVNGSISEASKQAAIYLHYKTSKLQRTRVSTIYLQTSKNKSRVSMIYLSYKLSYLWCYPRHKNKDPDKLVRSDAYNIYIFTVFVTGMSLFLLRTHRKCNAYKQHIHAAGNESSTTENFHGVSLCKIPLGPNLCCFFETDVILHQYFVSTEQKMIKKEISF